MSAAGPCSAGGGALSSMVRGYQCRRDAGGGLGTLSREPGAALVDVRTDRGVELRRRCPISPRSTSRCCASSGRAFPPAQLIRHFVETLDAALKAGGHFVRRAGLLHLPLRRAQRRGSRGDDRRRLCALLQRRRRFRGAARRGRSQGNSGGLEGGEAALGPVLKRVE